MGRANCSPACDRSIGNGIERGAKGMSGHGFGAARSDSQSWRCGAVSLQDRMASSRVGAFQSVPLGSLLGPAWAAEVVGPTGVTVRLSAQVPPSLAMQLIALTCRV